MPVIKHHLKPGDGENPLQATADEGRFDAERYLAFSDALRGLHRRIRQETDGFLGREADAVFDAGGSWEAHLDRGLPHNLWQMLLAPQATPEQRARLFSTRTESSWRHQGTISRSDPPRENRSTT